MPQPEDSAIVQQEKAIDFIRDWSKWLIGLNFTSGTGCVVVLQQGVSAGIKLYLVAAILFFALSTIISALLLAGLPPLIQRLPLKTKSGNNRPIYDYWIITPSLSIKTLTILQLTLFALGLIFLFTWVILKPAK